MKSNHAICFPSTKHQESVTLQTVALLGQNVYVMRSMRERCGSIETRFEVAVLNDLDDHCWLLCAELCGDHLFNETFVGSVR